MSHRKLEDINCAAPGDYLAGLLWCAEDDMLYFAGAVIDQLAIELANSFAVAARARGEKLGDIDIELEADDLACLVDGTPDMMGRRVTLRTEKLERYAVARLRYELAFVVQQQVQE